MPQILTQQRSLGAEGSVGPMGNPNSVQQVTHTLNERDPEPTRSAIGESGPKPPYYARPFNKLTIRIENIRRRYGAGVLGTDGEEKREVGGSLDFVEEGFYDVFWALVVAVRQRLGDEFLVNGRDVRHVVAGC